MDSIGHSVPVNKSVSTDKFHVFPSCWNSEEVPLCPTTGYVQVQSVLHRTRFGGKMG